MGMLPNTYYIINVNAAVLENNVKVYLKHIEYDKIKCLLNTNLILPLMDLTRQASPVSTI